MPQLASFSRRQGYAPDDPPITVWEDAPRRLRTAVITTAYTHDLEPAALRKIVCKSLREPPAHENDTPPTIRQEVDRMLMRCDWWKVYDVIEAISERIEPLSGLHAVFLSVTLRTKRDPQPFHTEINNVFRRLGIGWQLVENRVVRRGTEPFEDLASQVPESLNRAGMPKSAEALKSALAALSKRPVPDLNVAIERAFAGLECVCSSVFGKHIRLGKPLMNRMKREGIPDALATGVEKLYAYAQMARHPKEGRDLSRDDAVLSVHIAMALAQYFEARLSRKDHSPQ